MEFEAQMVFSKCLQGIDDLTDITVMILLPLAMTNAAQCTFYIHIFECLQGIDDMTDIIAMILLPVAVLMCGYALVVFLWRGTQIARKQVLQTACFPATAPSLG